MHGEQMCATGTSDMDELIETEDLSFGQVLACVFGVQSRGSRTYLTLLNNPGSTVTELAEVLNRNRSNVNRSLTTFLDKGLTERERRLFDPGSYVYQYTVTPLPGAREIIHAALDEWAKDAHARIDAFGES